MLAKCLINETYMDIGNYRLVVLELCGDFFLSLRRLLGVDVCVKNDGSSWKFFNWVMFEW